MKGSIIVWLIGIPFIALIVIGKNEYQTKFILKNPNILNNPFETVYFLGYLNHLINTYSLRNNSSILLNGFIEVHK